MSETSLERSLGRVEGALDALTKAVERIASEAERAQRELDARLDALEKRVAHIEIALVGVQTDVASFVPAIGSMAGMRRGLKLVGGVGATLFVIVGWFGDRIANFVAGHIR